MAGDVLSRNNVRVYGEGTRPMVFAHGFGCDQNMWRFVAPAFAHDHRIVLFDYVGSGKSDLAAYRPERYANLHGYAQDVLEVIDALDLRDVVFVGHSISSTIGMLAAIKEPARFAHLIHVGPSPCYMNVPPDYHGGFERADLEGLLNLIDQNFIGWASFFAATAMANPDRPELAQELEGSFCSTDPTIMRQFAEATFFSDHRADLSHVATPSLLLQCSEDAIVPVPVGEYMARTLPRATLRILAATGHCPHMSHPEETIAAMQDYLVEAHAPTRAGG